MTDVATYRVGEVIRPIDSAVWDFDGTDDVIDLGNINYNGLTGLTVATWVYSSNFAANDSFMSSWGDNSNSNYYLLLVTDPASSSDRIDIDRPCLIHTRRGVVGGGFEF